MSDVNILPRDQNHVAAAGFESAVTPGQVLPGRIDPDTGRILVVETAGGVIGPVTSTDNAVVLWNGTAGEEIKDSTLTVAAGVLNATGYKAGGTAAVADGTYTVGNRITPVTGALGTITTKGGIITAVQQAT